MSKASLLHTLTQQLSEIFPEQLNTFKKDFEKHCQRILSSTFAKFDVVTREEFDTQSKVLLRTRQKLEALEKQLQAIEKSFHRKTDQ